MCVFRKFMYVAFEQVLSMKRALYKFGIIIIIIWKIICSMLLLQLNNNYP